MIDMSVNKNNAGSQSSLLLGDCIISGKENVHPPFHCIENVIWFETKTHIDGPLSLPWVDALWYVIRYRHTTPRKPKGTEGLS